jgi:branched-chain amino acid transport system permease protein
MIMSFIFSIISTCYDLCRGHTGIPTFGQQAFYALGGYSSALVSMNLGFSPWLGLVIGGCTASIFSLFIGLPCLRLKGAYVSMVTLAFGVLTEAAITNLVDLTRGPMGLWGIPPLPPIKALGLEINFGIANKINTYYIALLVFFAALLIKHKLLNSNFGLAITAIKESQEAAESLGVNPTKYKLLTFAVSSFLTGVAGSFYAHYIGLLTPSLSNISLMIMILAMTYVGGITTLPGPVLGAFILNFLD